MAKKQPQTPLVSSMSTTLKKSIHTDTQVVSPEEVKTKKKEMLGVIDNALEQFKNNLIAGKVSMSTSADLERLVKLSLLLSGEADSRAGKPVSDTENESGGIQAASISMSKVEEILNLDDADVKNMYDKLFAGYNEANDLDD